MHTLKAEKNSSVRQTTILEGEEGRFRFVIRVSKNLMWGSVNGVMVHLTFDEGWQVNQYPIAIFKPGADIGDLVPTPGIGILQVSEQESKFEYVLESIALPKKMIEAEKPWYETKFAFRKLKLDGMEPTLRDPYISSTELAQLRVVVQPGHLYCKSQRFIALLVRPDGGARNKSRKFAAKSHITLETTIKRRSHSEPVQRVPEFHIRSISPFVARTFVFLYRERDHYDKIEDVELVDKTKARSGTPGEAFETPSQLPRTASGLGETFETENRAPRRRQSSKPTASRRRSDHPSNTPGTFPTLMPTSTVGTEQFPLPFLPDNDLSVPADPNDTPIRRVSDGADRRPLTPLSLKETDRQLESHTHMQSEEDNTILVGLEAESRSERSDTGPDTVGTTNTRGQGEVAVAVSGVLSLSDIPRMQVTNTSGHPIPQSQPAANAIEILRNSDSIRQEIQDAQKAIRTALQSQLERIAEACQEITNQKDELRGEFHRNMDVLDRRHDALQGRSESVQQQFEAMDRSPVNRELSEGANIRLGKVTEAAEEYRAHLRDHRDKLLETASKARKRIRSSTSSCSSPTTHRGLKRCAAPRTSEDIG